LARIATLIGLRAKATAMPDCSVTVRVTRAASASAGNTSCRVSAAANPAYPSFSARMASSSISNGDADTGAAKSTNILKK